MASMAEPNAFVGADRIESGATPQQYHAETTTPGEPGVASVGRAELPLGR
jgi:hypothetical protein